VEDGYREDECITDVIITDESMLRGPVGGGGAHGFVAAAAVHVMGVNTVSTRRVAGGNPAAEVYLAVPGRLGHRLERCATVEARRAGC